MKSLEEFVSKSRGRGLIDEIKPEHLDQIRTNRKSQHPAGRTLLEKWLAELGYTELSRSKVQTLLEKVDAGE